MSSIHSREDRILPLNEAASYPESPTVDMVLYFPTTPGKQYRMWLLTRSEGPEITINSKPFEPVDVPSQDGWWDFGIIRDLAGIMGPRFGHIAFGNLPEQDADDACCVITAQLDVVLSGSMQDAQRALWGLTRAEAGTTCITPSTMQVGEPHTFLMRYTAGKRGLPAGAYLRLCVPRAFATPQTENPQADGFLSVVAGDEPTQVYSIDTSVESHEKTDAIYRLPKGLPPHGELRFTYRTDFTYIHPESFGRAERTYWYSRLPPLAVAAAVDERLIFVAPAEENSHRVEFVPGPADRIHLFLPGRRTEDEHLQLRGVVTDAYRNAPPSNRRIPPIRLVLQDDERRRVADVTPRFESRSGFSADLPRLLPGVYRCVAVRTTDGQELARSNPLEVMGRDDERPRIYWGEIHCHSEMSDGSGDFRQVFELARDTAALDFAAGADHACYFSDNQWLWMQDVANSYNRDAHFVTLIGYEWAGRQGHRNIYTSGDRHTLFRGMNPATEELDTVYRFFRDRKDVVAGPHVHHTQDFYDGHDPEVQRFMEIYSMWGNYEKLGYGVLNKGAIIGFTGGGDNHEGHPSFSVEDPNGQGVTSHTFAAALRHACGVTAAVMPELSRTALVAALRNRNTYATTGARILLDVALCGTPMGGVVTQSEIPIITAEVHGSADLAAIDVICCGEVVHTSSPTGTDAEIRWDGTQASISTSRAGLAEFAAQHTMPWYCVRVRQKDGQIAWSSPMWIQPK